ncbi:MAG: methyltransferase family protein [Candidatus Thorarchaeota archaeon]
MLPELWTAIFLSLPLVTMIIPSIPYWREFRRDEKKGAESRKAKYNKPAFLIFVSGILAMWFFWIAGIFLSFLNSYYVVFGIITFTFEFDIYVQMVGFAFFYIGGAIYNWVLIVAGKYVRPAPSGALENHLLITTGPYGVVRHPLYFSYVCILFGLALLLSTYWLMIPLFCVLIGIYPTAKAEEEVLIDQFGIDYVEYQKEVGMLFPKRACKES